MLSAGAFAAGPTNAEYYPFAEIMSMKMMDKNKATDRPMRQVKALAIRLAFSCSVGPPRTMNKPAASRLTTMPIKAMMIDIFILLLSVQMQITTPPFRTAISA